jgi:hypothetical protein
VIAAHTPNWLVLAVIVVFVGLLAGPLGRWFGRPGAEKQEHAARDAAAQYLEPGEQIEAVVCGVVGYFGMKSRSLVLTDRRVLVLARTELERADPRSDVRTVKFGLGAQSPYRLVLEEPDGNRFYLQVVPAFRAQARAIADALS